MPAARQQRRVCVFVGCGCAAGGVVCRPVLGVAPVVRVGVAPVVRVGVAPVVRVGGAPVVRVGALPACVLVALVATELDGRAATTDAETRGAVGAVWFVADGVATPGT